MIVRCLFLCKGNRRAFRAHSAFSTCSLFCCLFSQTRTVLRTLVGLERKRATRADGATVTLSCFLRVKSSAQTQLTQPRKIVKSPGLFFSPLLIHLSRLFDRAVYGSARPLFLAAQVAQDARSREREGRLTKKSGPGSGLAGPGNDFGAAGRESATSLTDVSLPSRALPRLPRELGLFVTTEIATGQAPGVHRQRNEGRLKCRATAQPEYLSLLAQRGAQSPFIRAAFTEAVRTRLPRARTCTFANPSMKRPH